MGNVFGGKKDKKNCFDKNKGGDNSPRSGGGGSNPSQSQKLKRTNETDQ